MIDRKIPRALRDQIPLICVADEIAAIRVNEDWIIAYPFTESGEPEYRSMWLSYVRNSSV
jgi:hypothetical protein